MCKTYRTILLTLLVMALLSMAVVAPAQVTIHETPSDSSSGTVRYDGMDNGYQSLWDEVYQHSRADLPRSQMQVLQRIVEKARQEENYGQLLTAQLMDASLAVNLSPDSFEVVVRKIKEEEKKASTVDTALAAVYRTVLSRLLQIRHFDAEGAALYAKNAMEHPEKLATSSALGWQPFLIRGSDGSIFNDDLLSVVGFATGNAGVVHEYYMGTDNRKAQLVSAFMMLGNDDSHRSEQSVVDWRNECILKLDSLMVCYADLPECGELALRKVLLMQASGNYTARQQMEFIDEALEKWGGWKNAVALEEKREQLIAPHMQVDFGEVCRTPSQPLTLKLSKVRNPGICTVRASRLDVGQNVIKNKISYEELREHVVASDVKTLKVYPRDVQPYEFYDTTCVVGTLPVGIYLVEVSSDSPLLDPLYEIVHVSDVRLLDLMLPDYQLRLAVVNATSGQPVAHANIDVVDDDGQYTTLKTNKLGEVTFRSDKLKDHGISRFEAYTETDKASVPTSPYYRWSSSADDDDETGKVSCYTDRAIYRPGQTVNLAIIAMTNIKNKKFKPYKGEVEVYVEDDDVDEVVDTVLVTDEYGTAFISFVLPENGPLGEYSVEVTVDDEDVAYHTFHVEEYKRPTFEVELLPLESDDMHDDEVVVRGKAKAFSGAPVSGAMVAVDVKRSLYARTYISEYSDKQIVTDTIFTDSQGTFMIHIPSKVPDVVLTPEDSLKARWTYRINAAVTDKAGETHEDAAWVECRLRPYSLSLLSFPTLVEAGNTLQFTPQLTDRWGLPVDTLLSVWTDQSADAILHKSNQQIELPVTGSLTLPGIHRIYVGFSDEVKDVELTVADFTATKLGVETKDFFAQSDSYFPSNGGKVHVQLGSSLDSVHVLYSILAEDKIIENGSFDLSDAIHNRSFTYKKAYGKGLTLSYAFMKDGRLYQHSTTIQAPLYDKLLKMQWTTFRDKLHPGKEETWTLRVQNPDGSPAKAQLLATLYDASLDPLERLRWSFSPLTSTYLPQNRWSITTRNLSASTSAYHETKTTYPLSLNGFDDKLMILRSDSTVLRRILSSTKALSYGGMTQGRAGMILGMVRDENGEPVIGASVMLKGTKEGTVTNINGEFFLPSNGGGSIVVNYVGYAPQVVRASSGNFLEVRLEPDYNALQEVVVVGYGTMKKELMTGSVQIISGVAVIPEANLNASVAQPVYSVRENFEETAFFHPRLMTDDKGEFTIRFTLPESVTSWHFLGLAHDRKMNYAFAEALAVAQKEVMVQPNLPRFIRVGDEAVFTARVANLSDEVREGVAELTLSDITTGTVVWSGQQPFRVEAGTTGGVDFTVPAFKETAALVCRTVVSGDGFSDGEQQMVPVVPARELVTSTYPFAMKGRQKLELPLDRLLPVDADQRRLTFEYTAHPEWLAVGALPVLSATTDDDAVSQAAVYYANQLGRLVTDRSPAIRQMVMEWQNDTTLQSPLNSALQKNAGLKEMLLSETPWTSDADGERAMKRNMATFFDTKAMDKKCENALEQLGKLQNTDGGWPWCQGMGSSVYTSIMVMEMLARIQTLKPSKDCARLLDKGMTFLQAKVRKEVEEMQAETVKGRQVLPSEWLMHYLHIRALVPPQDKKPDDDYAYLLSFLKQRKVDLTIYGKAVCAVVMAREGDGEMAQEYLKSLKEYAVTSEEMGMYFDTPKAQRSWFNYEIPTVAMAIEATQLLTPEDTTSVAMMRQWLLMQKRTQSWESNVATVEAIHALFNDTQPLLTPFDASELSFTVDGTPIAFDDATAGVGYVRTVIDHGDLLQCRLEKNTNAMAWGAIYGQSLQAVEKVADDAQGLTVTRKLVLPDRPLRVGDKITVRITIRADRNYDFVQVCDRRPACLEPVNALSHYHWGYYSAKRDNATTYYFERLGKGEFVLEEEYYVDREGEYTSGTCVAQCAYAPEFKGIDGAYQLKVSR